MASNDAVGPLSTDDADADADADFLQMLRLFLPDVARSWSLPAVCMRGSEELGLQVGSCGTGTVAPTDLEIGRLRCIQWVVELISCGYEASAAVSKQCIGSTGKRPLALVPCSSVGAVTGCRSAGYQAQWGKMWPPAPQGHRAHQAAPAAFLLPSPVSWSRLPWESSSFMAAATDAHPGLSSLWGGEAGCPSRGVERVPGAEAEGGGAAAETERGVKGNVGLSVAFSLSLIQSSSFAPFELAETLSYHLTA